MVELMCNGTFENKDPNEAMEYLDLLAENAQNWDTTARKVEALELKKSGQLKSIQDIECQICETNEHSANDCPTLPSFKECLYEQAHALNSFQRLNHNPYSQTYNPGWRNHPNFSWKSDSNNAQTSQPQFQAHHNFQNSHGYAPPYAPPPRNGLMKLSFGNMTLEMNIFNIYKQPRDDNDLQEDEITDEKGTKNIITDHLSRLTIDSTSDITPIDDYFPEESLLSHSSMPWFAKNINFLASGDLPAHWSTEDKGKFLNEVKNFYWDDPNLFKYCPDQKFQRCIPDNEVRLSSGSSNSFISHMLGAGMVSVNREDKIQFIKDGLSKGSLDNLLLTLEMHPRGDVHRVIHDLLPQFHKEHDRLSLGNLTKKDPVCQFLRKLNGKPIPNP
ncbi:hypothetical protein D5086_008777 [Populus alba]|uniref:Uncharacterized protein n=1 Tax=Populus alba TaxID=43335 RepID=A0ACC4CGJ7_POPAL